MFGNYKFGDISKSIYNTVSGTNSTNDAPSESKELEETKTNNTSSESQQKGYQFGDITKSLYNKWSDPKYQYQFGDISKSLYRSITAQPDPFSVDIKNPIKAGFLQMRCPILLIYTGYWVALQGKCLYLFNAHMDKVPHKENRYLFNSKKTYSQCIQVIDLSSFDGARAIPSGVKGEFEIYSANACHRFFTTFNERTEWIHCLLKIIGTQRLHEIKESIMNINRKDPFDLQCVAYYIIDLEYTHSDSGDPQTLLGNENFIIATVIWSYVHDENKPFYLELVKDLDDDQRQSLKYWQQPIAIAHGIRGGLQGAKKEQVKAMKDGANAAVCRLGYNNISDLVRGMTNACNDPTCPACPSRKARVIIPLYLAACAVSATGKGVANVPSGFATGFKDTYNSLK